MGTTCAPVLADIFLYSYEAEFIQSLLSTGKKKIASQFNFTYRYIDDVLSINNPDFEIILVRCIPHSLRSKTRRRATPLLTTWIYIVLLSIESDGQLCTSLYDKCADFNFNITNFPFLSSNFHFRQPMVFYLTDHTVYHGLLLLWMLYSMGGATFI